MVQRTEIFEDEDARFWGWPESRVKFDYDDKLVQKEHGLYIWFELLPSVVRASEIYTQIKTDGLAEFVFCDPSSTGALAENFPLYRNPSHPAWRQYNGKFLVSN